jgi:hypothetical protein
MRLPTKILTPALLLAAVPLFAGSASAAPLSQSLALNQAETGTVEQVQYRDRRAWRYHRGYYAFGAAPCYYAYGAAPGYYVGPRRRAWNYGNGSAATGPGSAAICPADRFDASGYPSWMCR